VWFFFPLYARGEFQLRGMSLHHIVKTALHLRSVEVKLVFQKKGP
jgi:hypothetical protein